jgi:type IV pilus assembly protein PilB
MADVILKDPLIQALMEQHILGSEQLSDIEEEHVRTGKSIREIILNLELINEEALLAVIAENLGTKVISLPALDIPPDVVRSVPPSLARMYNVVPVQREANSVTVATFDMVNPAMMDELMFVLSQDVNFVLAREDDIRARVSEFYGDDSAAVNEMLTHLESDFEAGESVPEIANTDDAAAIEEAAGSAPVVRYVNLVLYQAVQARASDIHFEPFEHEFKIRYRVDGALYEMLPPPKRLALPIISRIKVIASLNIAERRLPQDGRIQMAVAGRPVDFRVSTLPTQFGESVVLRVLDRTVVSLDLANLGMPEDVYTFFETDVLKPNGIIIVTGPTGSGKTTTLYSALNRINTIENKLLTAEDPVEYEIDGIVQVPISEAIGNSFDRVLRAFLRQDPDILMIGEIRDLNTAQIAIRASLTGHLVFSTLHTNDAAGAITRLIDMEVEPFLISSTLEAVLGQRLVRKVCENCKKPFKPDKTTLDRLSISERDIGDRPFFQGVGCSQCNNTGYRGRKGIYEYLAISDPVRDLINQRQPTLVIRTRAIELGMRTLRQDGIRNILDGYTTVDEVMKYT